MKKPLIKKLEDPVYNRCMYLAVGPQQETIEKVEKIMKYPRGTLDVDERRAGAMHTMQDGAFVLWIPFYDWSISHCEILTHEVFHLTYAVMDSIGIKLHDSSEEAFAYFHGYVMKQILTLIKEAK